MIFSPAMAEVFKEVFTHFIIANLNISTMFSGFLPFQKKEFVNHRRLNDMFCAISFHLYNFKNVKNNYGGVLHGGSNTPPWVFFTFSKLQMLPNCVKHHK